MELWCKDDVASTICKGNKQKVVALVHSRLGLASVVEITNVPEKQALKLETASGSILVDYAFKDLIPEQADTLHPSHVTRISDASSFDEICVNCGATDQVLGGWGKLAEPCPNPQGK